MATATAVSLPCQREWTVVGVREGKVTDNPQGGGQLQAFYVDFDQAEDVYWRRKLPATVEVGKSYFGTVSQTDRGLRFKKESPGSGSGSGGGGGGGSRAAGGSREWKPESQYDPEKTARIGRSHAQGMALQWLGLGDVIPAGLDQLTPIIDWFEADVQAAAARATGPSTPAAQAPPPSTPAAASPAPQVDERAKFVSALESKALSGEAAGKLADFIMRLAPEDRSRAWNGLGQFDLEVATLRELEEGYANTEGEPLPKFGPAEDDIPF